MSEQARLALAELQARFDRDRDKRIAAEDALILARVAIREAEDLLDVVYDADDPEHGRYAAWLALPAVKAAKP
jgi:hypothetical protein